MHDLSLTCNLPGKIRLNREMDLETPYDELFNVLHDLDL